MASNRKSVFESEKITVGNVPRVVDRHEILTDKIMDAIREHDITDEEAVLALRQAELNLLKEKICAAH
jgi:hypothetical protein